MKKLLFSACAVLAILGCSGDNVNNLPPLGGEENALDGTWQRGSQTIEISGKNAVLKDDNVNYAKGTVSFSGSNFSWTTTHIWDGQKWIAHKEKPVTCNYMQTNMQANGQVSSENCSSFKSASTYRDREVAFPNTTFGIGKTPPPRQVTRFSMASSIFAIWGNIQYESGGAVPGIPAQLRSVRNGEQSTLAGKRVPIAFADGSWIGDNAFSVSDATGLSISISRNGLSNSDGTAELQIYRDQEGGEPISLNQSIPIPDDTKVLVLWVTGNYEASE